MHAEGRVGAGEGSDAIYDGRREGSLVQAQLVHVPGQHVRGLPGLLPGAGGEASPGAAVVEVKEGPKVERRHEERRGEVVEVHLAAEEKDERNEARARRRVAGACETMPLLRWP